MRSLKLALRYTPNVSSVAFCSSSTAVDASRPEAKRIWRQRQQFAQPKIQRFEKEEPKVWYAPTWDLAKTARPNDKINPLQECRTTPEKWNYRNEVVWPVDHKVAETGQPKAREVYYVEESVHQQPKKMWSACQFALRMRVAEAILQLKFQQTKPCLILANTLSKAMEKGEKDLKLKVEDMFVAEAFAIQHQIIKSQRRHAREHWATIRHRYVHIYVRLEEGDPPIYKGRAPMRDGWQHMDAHYEYLRNREFKYSL